jgi:hypothetical protein
MKITTSGFHVVTLAAGLLLAVSGPSIAAKRASDTKSAAKLQSRAVAPGGSANSGSAIRSYGRDDPYAPGVNWPGRW